MRPEVMPDTCGECSHFEKRGILDRFRGHCTFYNRTTYKSYPCFGAEPSPRASDDSNSPTEIADAVADRTDSAGTPSGVNETPFARPHTFVIVFAACLIAFAVSVRVLIPATRLVDPDALADNVALIQWVHLLALVVLTIAAFEMFGTAGRLFKASAGRNWLVRAVVRLTGVVPVLCGLLFFGLGVVTLYNGLEIPQPVWDRRPLFQEVDGPLADFHQQHCRFVRLTRLTEAISVSLFALLLAYGPGFVAWVVTKRRRVPDTAEPSHPLEPAGGAVSDREAAPPAG